MGGSGGTTSPVVVELAGGDYHVCALFSDSTVKCWGDNATGQLGYGNKLTIGDDEKPSAVGTVSITNKPGVTVKHIKARGYHTCALLSDGTLKCWGAGQDGVLGYGNVNNIGDDELPSSVGPVSVSTDPALTVTDMGMGFNDTCAILSNGALKCWGLGDVLGLGNTNSIGDDELPSSAPAVAFPAGLKVLQVASGYSHTCALLSDHAVTCWGAGDLVGYADKDWTLSPRSYPVSLTTLSGVTVAQIDAHAYFSCARLSNGTATCWGSNTNGQLGRGNTNTIGDDELPSSLGGPISITSTPGLSVTQISVGGFHACALLSDGSLKCWGSNVLSGTLGLGQAYMFQQIGDDELPSSVGPISITNQLGVTVVQAVAGQGYTCALLSDHSVKCWGDGEYGTLGQGNTTNIGEYNVPSDVPPIEL
jgi:alpha-tubulin suppressor-like RCC1 family protein